MTWEIFFGIAGFLLGGGALGMVFAAGRKHGETNSKIESISESLKEIKEDLEKLQSGHSNSSLTNANNCQTHKELIRKDLEEKARIIHSRIDTILQDKHNAQDSVGKLRQQIEAIVTGIQTQRSEWETLKGDVRGLLKAEAASTVEIINLKKRLDVEEERVNKHAEKLAADRADLDRLLRGK
jgi:chromosome segregation ATPase